MAVLVAGCGGDDDTDEPSAQAQSNAPAANDSGASAADSEEFASQTDAICRRISREILVQGGLYVEQRSGSGKSEAELNAEMISAVIIPKLEAEAEELEGLEPSAGEEDDFEAYLTALNDAIEASKETAWTASSLKQFGDEFEEQNKLAARNGMSSCGVFF